MLICTSSLQQSPSRNVQAVLSTTPSASVGNVPGENDDKLFETIIVVLYAYVRM